METVDTTNPAYRHGHTGLGKFSPEYHSWASMKTRCLNRRHRAYKWYGARGITVCSRWMTFENFLTDMGLRPLGMSLERKENDKGYYPANCVWAPRKIQARNSRQVVWVTIENETRRLVEWCELKGVSINTVRDRVRFQGMDYVTAIVKPTKR